MFHSVMYHAHHPTVLLVHVTRIMESVLKDVTQAGMEIIVKSNAAVAVLKTDVISIQGGAAAVTLGR